MKLKTALVCLLFLSALFSAQLCESLKVRVFGENYLPVGGAGVSVNYQKNDFTSLDGFESASTGEDGTASIALCNQVYPNPAANWSYKISVSAFSLKQETWTTFGSNVFNKVHFEDFVFNISVQGVNITVRDHTGKPIQNADVELSRPYAASKKTNALGVASFVFPVGSTADFAASYKGESSRVQTVVGSSAASINVTLSFYNMTLVVKAFDENVKPLPGTQVSVEYAGKTKTGATNLLGTAYFETINSLDANVTASYRGLNKTNKTLLVEGAGNMLEFNFTKNPLEISYANASAEFASNNCSSIRVTVDANDPRFQKKGLDANLKYFFDGTALREREKKLKFNESASVFYADVSCANKALPLNFSFRVAVNNTFDSRETGLQSYLFVLAMPIPSNGSNATAAGTSNGTPSNATPSNASIIIIDEPKPEPIWKSLEGIKFDLRTLLQAAISIIIMAIVLYLLITLATSLFKRKRKEGPEDVIEKLKKEVEEEMAKKQQAERETEAETPETRPAKREKSILERIPKK